MGFLGRIDLVEGVAEAGPEFIDGEDHGAGGLVGAVIVPDAPEHEQDEGFVLGELGKQVAGLRAGTRLEQGEIVVDDEFQAERREVVAQVAAVVVAGEQEMIAARAAAAEQGAAP